MAKEKVLSVNKVFTFDSGDPGGPWTLKMPASPAGSPWCTAVARDNNATNVTLDGNGQTFEHPVWGPNVASQVVQFNGGSIKFRWNAGRTRWFVEELSDIVAAPTPAPQVFTPVFVTATPHQINAGNHIYADPTSPASLVLHTPAIASLNTGARFRVTNTNDTVTTFTLESQDAATIQNPQDRDSAASVVLTQPRHTLEYVLRKTGSPVWDLVTQTTFFEAAAFTGEPSNLTPGAHPTPVAIVGYDQEWRTDLFTNGIHSSTGYIDLPQNGQYRVKCKVIAQQGNTNTGLAILLQLMSTVQGNNVIDVFDVANSATDWRTWNANFIYGALAGESIRLGLSWAGAATPGTMTMHASTFEVEMIGGKFKADTIS